MFELVGLTLMESLLKEVAGIRRDLATLMKKEDQMNVDLTQFQAELDDVQKDVNDLGAAVGDLATSIGNIPSRIQSVIDAAVAAQKASDQAAFDNAMTELKAIAATAKSASTAAAAAKTAADAIELPTPAPAPVTLTLVGPDGTTANVAVTVGGTAQATGTSSDGAVVTYSSDDPTIATVDATGLVTGVAAGSTAIEAANPTGQKVSLGVTVS